MPVQNFEQTGGLEPGLQAEGHHSPENEHLELNKFSLPFPKVPQQLISHGNKQKSVLVIWHFFSSLICMRTWRYRHMVHSLPQKATVERKIVKASLKTGKLWHMPSNDFL